MPPALYTTTLLALLQAPDDTVKRRALRLFDATLARVSEPEDVAAAMGFCGQVFSAYTIAVSLNFCAVSGMKVLLKGVEGFDKRD